MTPEEQRIIQALLGGAMPGGPFANAGMPGAQAQKPQTPPLSIMDPAGFQAYQEGSLGADRTFAPGPGTRVADAEGSIFATKMAPETGTAADKSASAAAAYRALMEGFDRYRALIPEDGNLSLMPNETRDDIATERLGLQMQMKELLNLGVLNGPDKEILDEMMIDPYSLKNKFFDLTGLADTESRTRNNIKTVANIFERMAAPKLEMLGLNPSDIYSPQMSDADLLKELGLE